MSGKYRHDHNCLNCGHHVEEHYCSRCGQPNLELKESFWAFISHSIAHYFHFDNKFFQTLVPLITKPGQVTLDYLAGKRARYINPVSMYIFVSIVYFLVAFNSDKSHKKEESETAPVKTEVIDKETEDAIASVKSNKFKEVMNEVKSEVKASAVKSNFKKLSFPQQDSVLKQMRVEMDTNDSDSINDLYGSLYNVHKLRNDSTYEAYLARQKTLAEADRDNWYERFFKKRSIEFDNKGEKIEEILEHNRPKQYFLFMPLMALFIMLNFRRNHIYYLDHLIFTIHGMTAFFLVQIIANPLIKYIPSISWILELAVLIWVLWYMYKALRIFYNRSKSTTIWRMVWISILYATALGISETVIRNVIYYMAA